MIVNVINISDNKLPQYETGLSAGMDVRADFSRVTPDNPIKAFGDCEILFPSPKMDGNKITMLRLDPGARALIPTGLFMQMPEGDGSFRYECQVRPRSGTSLKQGLIVLNTPGTIDEKYRGEVCVIVINLSNEFIKIHNGDRIAQAVLMPVYNFYLTSLEKVSEINENTGRGKNGFGSSGTK